VSLAETGIGRPVPRNEDVRLLTGRGRYTDDYPADGALHAVMLRSPHAHARIRVVNTVAAERAPGVKAVLTALDWRGEGLGPMPLSPSTVDINDVTRPALVNRDGSAVFVGAQYPLASDRVRHVGEAVAMVVAETEAAARDAAELIEVEYDALPAVTDAMRAIEPGAPAVWDDRPDNVLIDAEFGDEAAVERAFAAAAHVVRRRFVNNRVSAVAMEPRAALARFDAESGSYELIAGSQGSHRLRDPLAKALGVGPDKLRVRCEDVGGGFGMRNGFYVEHALVLWAARKTGKPVKWVASRSESFLSDVQARDLVTDAALAFDANGRMTALRVELYGNVGAHTVSTVPLANGSRIVTTVYDVPAACVRTRAIMTHTLPTAPYRGAGRPEAMLAMERLIDEAAAELGVDRIELRRRNLIPPGKLPYRTPVDVTYDSGAFAENMETALALADWAGAAARKAASAARGCLRGIGLSNYVETPVGFPREMCRIAVDPAGSVEILAGTHASGQGHETSFPQVVAELLGVPFERVRLRTGDTALIPDGGGSHSDRSMRLAGTLMFRGSAAIIARGKAIAAHLLEAAEDDIAFADGRFSVIGTDRAIGLFETAAKAITEAVPERLRGPLAAEEKHFGRIPAYPTGCAVCELEVDPETGRITIDRWSAVDDVGRVVNPLIVAGQIHGGIAQGVGQALLEDIAYEDGTGQLRGGSFMDYAMPRADDLPSFAVEEAENAPTLGNPLGIKGGGESGTTPAPAAFMNALADALRPLGVADVRMPATPARVWQAIRDARRGGRGR
jgi:carbon-monoxide dehydrogenase large subunit